MPQYRAGIGQQIPLRDFSPDLDPTTPGIILDALNALPTVKGFASEVIVAPAMANPLPARCLGAAQIYSGFTPYAATSQHIYYNGGAGSWIECDSNQVFSATSRWRFAFFANDVIAVSDGQTPQVSSVLVPTPSFSPLNVSASGISTPPVILSIAGFVMIFGGQFWACSAAGSDSSWTPDIQTLAATGSLYDLPGNIVAAAPIFRNPIVFKNKGIWLGSFTGAPFTWTFQLISDNVGTWGQECVVPLPDSVAFLGTDDFYICTGYTPQRIPNNLKEWFFDNAATAQLPNVCGYYDDLNDVIYWHWASNQAPAGVLDMYVGYGVRAQRWTVGHRNVSYVLPNSAYAYGNMGTNEWIGPFFDTSNFLNQRDDQGNYAGASLKTGFLGNPDKLTQLMRCRVRYNIAPTSQSMAWFNSNGPHPPVTAAIPPTLGSDNWWNGRQYNRYHQVQLGTVGEMEATQITYEFREGGLR